jgi:citrate lyase alpha subunit
MDLAMTAQIIQFPQTDASPEQELVDLVLLHDHIGEEMLKEKSGILHIVLTLDEAALVCKLIRAEVGPEWFGDEPAA